MAACSDEKIQGCIALPTVTDLWNILRRVPDASRRSALRSICELLEVVGTAHDEVISAIEMAQFKAETFGGSVIINEFEHSR